MARQKLVGVSIFSDKLENAIVQYNRIKQQQIKYNDNIIQNIIYYSCLYTKYASILNIKYYIYYI